MKITKAVITAAAKRQRSLPLQTVIDQDGAEKPVLGIIIEEILRSEVEEICVVVWPGDEDAYKKVVGGAAAQLHFVQQPEPLGYGHAVCCAKDFLGNNPFLHLVGDHLYVSRSKKGCAQHLVEVAEATECAVSAVQTTRENLLPLYGAIGGQRVAGHQDLYRIETVLEKPTPTEAEERLIVPGLRAGYYLSFFGMHVLTPTVVGVLEQMIKAGNPRNSFNLSDALAEVAKQEQYLALEASGWRYDVGVKYGLLMAQLALALNGKDRDEVLSRLLTLLATRQMGETGK